jgi:hypothetical protein
MTSCYTYVLRPLQVTCDCNIELEPELGLELELELKLKPELELVFAKRTKAFVSKVDTKDINKAVSLA